MNYKCKYHGIYRHFKGNYFFAKEIAICSETGKDYVVYQHLYGDYKTYIRPVEMFCESIDVNRKDNVTGQSIRFEFVEQIGK